MRAVLFASCVACLAACSSANAPEAGGRDDADSGAMCGTVASSETHRVFESLSPHCAGCHQTGTRGFFATVITFQELLVSDPRFVTPGAPDDSELVRLLEGRGTGSFPAMPIGERSYADLVDAGVAELTLAEVREWIAGLTAQVRSEEPAPEVRRVRRISALQIRRALYQQLGLDDADFYLPAMSYSEETLESINGDDRYPLRAPEDLPGPFSGHAPSRHQGLGGGSVFEQTSPSEEVAPTFVLTLMQTSQRWCRIALEKEGATPLFPSGTMGDDAASVTDTIHRWSLHFHAEAIDEREVERLRTTVYEPLRDETDSLTGYIGLCSYFIRHPSWIFY